MKIAKTGWPFILAGLVPIGLGLGLHCRPGWEWPGGTLTAIGVLYTAFALYFFRDPERPLPADQSKIYSPGDGVVLSVGREGPGETVTLRIFLSAFDVHVQRAPSSGVVKSVVHHEGSFVAAMKDAARGNERTVMTLEPGGGRPELAVEQIAGLVARRIKCWSKPGDRLTAGQRYGIIHFGSQAAVHFPSGSRCTVKVGDRVVAGITPIGEWLR